MNWLAATLRLSAKDDQNGAGPTFDGTSLLVREGTIKAFPKAPAASTAPPSAPPSVGKAPETNASALEWPWMLPDLKLPDLKDFQLRTLLSAADFKVPVHGLRMYPYARGGICVCSM